MKYLLPRACVIALYSCPLDQDIWWFNLPTYLYNLLHNINIYILFIHPIYIYPSVLSHLDLLCCLSKIPSVTRYLQPSSSTSRTKTAWTRRRWLCDRPPHLPSPICWSGCRMQSVTTGSSILSPHFIPWVMVPTHWSKVRFLNSRVHICEEENSAADAQGRWSRAFRVCAQKMEEPGVAQRRGQDHRWCNRISLL